jgi:hypothetical protein
MNWSSLKKRFSVGTHIRAGPFVAPNFALDVDPGFVAAARLSPSKRLVQSVGVRGLPAGVLEPSANKSNVTDSTTLRRTIAEVCERVGNGGGKLGLLIPDVAARVALLQFEALPDNRQEAETLVLWRMREFLPYPPDEARMSFQVLAKQPGAVEVLGVAVRGSVLAEYEAAMAGINGGPALVLPASVALLPLLPEDEGGQLLLHLCLGSLTAVVVASNQMRYWRTRPLEGDPQRNLEEVAREVTRVLATCQDNLNVKVQNVWYCERTPADAKPKVESALLQVLDRELRPLMADAVLRPGLPTEQRVAFDHFGMPFAGLVANLSQKT